MPNERLRATIAAKDHSIQSVADHVQVDPKTVERWITKDRVPHRGHRWKTAQLLAADELYLWPSVEPETKTASSAELATFYPNRGAVPGSLWASLIDNAVSQIDILVYAGLFLLDSHPDFAEDLADKAAAGAQVRILLGDPTSEALRQRGEEEGIGDDLAARARLSMKYLLPATRTPGVELRQHSTILYNSIYRFDDDLLVNPHVFGAPAGQNPMMHFRYVPGARTFRHYLRSFDRVWELGTPTQAVR